MIKELSMDYHLPAPVIRGRFFVPSIMPSRTYLTAGWIEPDNLH